MTAGMNCKVRLWRMENLDDDIVGGAVVSGTAAYSNIRARIEANPDEQLLLQQGLETTRTFNALVVPGTLDIRERDELEVIAPGNHIYYAARFRIMGVQYSSMDTSNPNNYTRLSMIRSVRSHATQ